jgi:ABC-type transporter Mla MlaB component
MIRSSHPPEDGQVQWYRVGSHLRPLAQQLDALFDAGAWAAVIVDAVGAHDRRPADRIPAGLTITSTQRGNDYAAVSVSGDVDGDAIPLLRRHLHAILNSGIQNLVIDLSGIGACDGRLVALLSRLQLRVRTRHGTFHLMRIPLQIRPLFTVGDLPDSLAGCDQPFRSAWAECQWATRV